MFEVDREFDKEVEATKCRKLVVGRLCCDGRFFMSKRTLDKALGVCVK